jgi:hypothetical protein
MTSKTSAPVAVAKKKLLSRIAAMQRQADLAKKTAKLAKLGLRAAKDRFKAAKRAAKKLRKEVKALKVELAGLGSKKAPAKRAVKKPAVKRSRTVPVAAPASAPVEVVSLPPEVPPTAPV